MMRIQGIDLVTMGELVLTGHVSSKNLENV